MIETFILLVFKVGWLVGHSVIHLHNTSSATDPTDEIIHGPQRMILNSGTCGPEFLLTIQDYLIRSLSFGCFLTEPFQNDCIMKCKEHYSLCLSAFTIDCTRHGPGHRGVTHGFLKSHCESQCWQSLNTLNSQLDNPKMAKEVEHTLLGRSVDTINCTARKIICLIFVYKFSNVVMNREISFRNHFLVPGCKHV